MWGVWVKRESTVALTSAKKWARNLQSQSKKGACSAAIRYIDGWGLVHFGSGMLPECAWRRGTGCGSGVASIILIARSEFSTFDHVTCPLFSLRFARLQLAARLSLPHDRPISRPKTRTRVAQASSANTSYTTSRKSCRPTGTSHASLNGRVFGLDHIPVGRGGKALTLSYVP